MAWGRLIGHWHHLYRKALEEPEGPIADKILTDRLADLREGSLFSMPVSSILSLLIFFVQLSAGHFWAPAIWLVCITVINVMRFADALYYRRHSSSNDSPAVLRTQLRRIKLMAAIAGFLWTGVVLLAHGFSIPQFSIYMVILAGICAGAVTYGASSAAVSINFITLPLWTTVVVLLVNGGLHRVILAVSIALFWAALVRGALLGQRRFLEALRLKYEARQIAREMEMRSYEDPLTGLLNRRGLENAVYGFSPTEGPFIVMLIDLDGFKSVNDTYGHKVGDDLLVAIADRIRNVAPERAVLARIGGDEFALLYPEALSRCEPELKAARIIASVTAYHQGVLSVEIGACVGICRLNQLDPVDMLLRADFALYTAKRRGRNEYHFFEEKLHQDWERKQSIERDLRIAIETRQVQTRFQPIVELRGGTIIGFEGLLRWEHPQHGFISPPEIIDIACEVGVIRQLTQSVVVSCCEMIEMLCNAGRTDLTVAMNLSPRELANARLPREILVQLERRGLPASMLEIEITEETPFDQRTIENIRALSAAGLPVALDDFGTGFATFASLKGGVFDKIKIDKVFVQGIAQSTGDQHVVRAIIELARALGITVTAEGIETEADRDILSRLGCHAGQGYLFYQVLPPEQAFEALKGPEFPMAQHS